LSLKLCHLLCRRFNLNIEMENPGASTSPVVAERRAGDLKYS